MRLTSVMSFASLVLPLFLISVASAQPAGPQPWWPVQPRPLPFVHTLFSDDMVLQREIAVPVWGWSTPGDRIAITVDDKSAGDAVVAGSDGRWTTKIGPFVAGGPHTITISGTKQKATLANVLFGDVWLCGGQSNMNWPVRLASNADEEVKNANYPEIRSFNVGFYSSFTPMKLPPHAKWETCTPDFAKNFTAVGYFFAREIHQKTKVPIGIIHASAGATAVEAWLSGEAMRRDMPFDFHPLIDDVQTAAAALGPDYDFFRTLENWMAKADPSLSWKKASDDATFDADGWRDVEVPKPWEELGFDDKGLVLFRREIEIPATWRGRDLHFVPSIVKDSDLTWFNGKLVGSLQQSGIRRYTIHAADVRPGKNVIVMAIVNGEGPGGFCAGPSNMIMQPAVKPNGEQIRIGGTWKAKAVAGFDAEKMPFPAPAVGHYKTVTSLYNGMIAPLTPFGIKGALWYQGEANGPFWLQYRRALPTLIADWRSRFGVGDFPFLIVSLANLNQQQTKPIEPGWAEIRESQWRTVRKVPNTGLAMTIDIGDPKDIHPRNKQEVGRRLSLVARKMVYGEPDLIASGPEFIEHQIELPKGDKIRLYFKNLGGGLMIRPGDTKLTGFAVAGPDMNFVWADAVIEGDTVVVSSPEVEYPKFVRYGWAWNPIVNLYNKAGLPAITFRTDE